MLKQHAAKYWEWRLVDWKLMVKVDFNNFSNNDHIFKHESFLRTVVDDNESSPFLLVYHKIFNSMSRVAPVP